MGDKQEQGLQKIKSRQRRKRGQTMHIIENKYNEIERQNLSLEKHVDGEIFIPKVWKASDAKDTTADTE